jgi:probable rRNA maturation factor
MAILIDNQQSSHPIEKQQIQRKTRAVLNALGSPDDELSIVLVDDNEIARLNEQHLGHQGPTNVISFSMREGEFGDVNPQLIGDVVISMDTCAREAAMGDISISERLDALLVHGILHLFGYDHTRTEAQARQMDARSRELIELLKGIEHTKQ